MIAILNGRIWLNKKTILFVTGTRADFGKIKTLMKIVQSESDLFELQCFVTGMHMLQQYGKTYFELAKSGFNDVYHFINQHMNEPMEMVLANTIQGISRYVHEEKPDLIIVHGDRIESLAGAIVGSINNILVAHIEGGERSGTIDELIRHSISKLSHIHFTTNQDAAKRLVQLGEQEENIYVIGSPDIDVMMSDSLPSLEYVYTKYEIKYDTFHLVLFHPVTTECSTIYNQALALVDALNISNDNFIVIYPNNDCGTVDILRAYTKLHNNPRIKLFPSIQFECFLVLIKNTLSLIGNSSAGIHEAPIYGTPTINIGSRQNNRFKTKSIIDCEANKGQILESIQKMSSLNRFEPIQYFGTGNSTHYFEQAIKSEKFWQVNPQKVFVDL
ncbi:MAG: UDP-N-acetylglucosamine 2-epimerase (hydrolyzing) [gamma proteobacterium symbiont of Taylorina sp.]|nr:UDP-N-acetylglucosamine 2-epimerase (hydrolyzing) [gamma proteobacterium symbiont of Taylorina sp.]